MFERLPGAEIVTLQGLDAVNFCHAQFASDVARLVTGHWQWSTWLTPKGRVIAIFLLARSDEQEITLILFDGAASTLAEQLRRFIFRRKLQIEVRDDLAAFGNLASAPSSGNRVAIEPQRLLFDLGASGMARTLCVQPSESEAMENPDFALTWRQLDLRMGLPRLDASQREQWTPQQIGLDRLRAYSVNKGCYPGQEIVARTHFLGKAKRSTQLLEVVAEAQSGDEVRQHQQSVGSLASTATGLALAVLPLELEQDDLVVLGQPAHVLPLLDGLAR